MPKTFKWHSDLDRDISIFLAENRYMPFPEKLAGVQVLVLNANLDNETLLYYASYMFIARDQIRSDDQEFPFLISALRTNTKQVLEHIAKENKSKAGKAAADALHSKPGHSRDKQEAIRAAWASGKYSSRDVCAEQECAALNMAFGTARRALRNTPEPPRRCAA